MKSLRFSKSYSASCSIWIVQITMWGCKDQCVNECVEETNSVPFYICFTFYSLICDLVCIKNGTSKTEEKKQLTAFLKMKRENS